MSENLFETERYYLENDFPESSEEIENSQLSLHLHGLRINDSRKSHHDQGYCTLSGQLINWKYNRSSHDPFDKLSKEMLAQVFSWLNSFELLTVARVCKRFEKLVWNTPKLWKTIQFKEDKHINGDRALKIIFKRFEGHHNGFEFVERVFLGDCFFSDKGLLLLSRKCTDISHLQIQSSAVSNRQLCDFIRRMRKTLQHLDISGCDQIVTLIDSPSPQQFPQYSLQYIDLSFTRILDHQLKLLLLNACHLVYLYLRNLQITDQALKYIQQYCINNLKELSISDCVNVTDFGLYELAKLSSNKGKTIDIPTEFVHNLNINYSNRTVKYLSIAKCFVSDAGLKIIARKFHKLRYLNIRGCAAISDDSIMDLAKSCTRLRALDMGKCDITDRALIAIAEGLPNLKKLSLKSCDSISDVGLIAVAYYCRGLQFLNIQDCQITVEGYRAVKKYCKKCIIEHTNPGFC